MDAKGTDLPFLKMHGAGNDFVVIDGRSAGALVSPHLARALADRHFGVGCDQVIEILPAKAEGSERGHVALRFWNADGSTAGACGNGTRCAASLIMGETGLDRITIENERGFIGVERRGGQIWVNMGAPLFDWQQIPLSRKVDPLHLPLADEPVAVSMGNPHCVHLVADVEAVDLARLGPALEHDPLFPERTNVEFVSLLGPDRLRMRVWERGAGITLACGSGACAAAVAAHMRGLVGRKVVIVADGGTLAVDWREDGVWLTGPVATVFRGLWLAGTEAEAGPCVHALDRVAR